jgi:hypothetical protein
MAGVEESLREEWLMLRASPLNKSKSAGILQFVREP